MIKARIKSASGAIYEGTIRQICAHTTYDDDGKRVYKSYYGTIDDGEISCEFDFVAEEDIDLYTDGKQTSRQLILEYWGYSDEKKRYFCPECGYDQNRMTRFCPDCGTEFHVDRSDVYFSDVYTKEL